MSSTAPTSNNGVSDIYTITAADGSKATVHSQGGHVTSWVGTDGDERLYLSPAHKCARGKPIRGGIPIIFPQFSDMGKGPTHGVARSRQWVRLDVGENGAVKSRPGVGVFGFRIPKGDTQFPGAASLVVLTVTVSDEKLTLSCKVTPTSDTTDKDFSLLFHTYFAVSDVTKVKVFGFDKKPYANGLKKRQMETTEPAGRYHNGISNVVDSIYYGNGNDVQQPLQIVDEALGRTIVISGSETCNDVVLWNPGPETIGKFADLPQPDGYKHFLCIEHGALAPRAVFPSVESGKSWEGTQTIRVIKHNKNSNSRAASSKL